jgi:hypothetical protein
VARCAQPAVTELLEVARLERRPHRGQVAAEPRAEHRKIRLVAESKRRLVEQLDLLHAELLDQLVEVPLRRRRAEHADAAQGLAKLHAGLGASLAAELDDLP